MIQLEKGCELPRSVTLIQSRPYLQGENLIAIHSLPNRQARSKRGWARRFARSISLVGLGIILGACGARHSAAIAQHSESPAVSQVVASPLSIGTPATTSGNPGSSARTALLTPAAPVLVERNHRSGLRPAYLDQSRTYVVQPGDTVWGLAQRYGDSGLPLGENVERILRWNSLRSDATLQPGALVRVAP